MNVLLLCTKFSVIEKDAWLTNDLAKALADLGHSVQVVCVDWSEKSNLPPRRFVTSTGVKVALTPPLSLKLFGSRIGGATKWLLSSLAARKIVKQLSRNVQFDLLIGFSPAITMGASLLASMRQPGIKSCYVLWDFFPYHHQQIGLIHNRFIFACAKMVEQYLIRRFDFIGCMTEMNVNYLKEHYNLKVNQQVGLIPLWGNSAPIGDVNKSLMRQEFGLQNDKVVVVFGGQLTVGRGIEDILSVARMAQANCDNIHFLFIGDGPYEALIQREIENGAKNVVLLKRVPRDKYLQLLSACDIALVCTVKNVDVPTFPSKTIDYLKASLPIVASVEASTDYGDYIRQWESGYFSKSGELDGFYKNIKKLSDDPAARLAMGKNGNDWFKEKMDVSVVSNTLLKHLFKK